MSAYDIIKNLAPLEKHRTSLYLSPEKLESWYLQKVSQIVELDSGEDLSGKIEASVLGILKSEVGGNRTQESKVSIEHPIVQGVVAEKAARASKTLVDLSSTEPRKGELLYYLGPARIAIMSTTISPDNAELNDEECSAIESVRHSHEDFLKAFDPTVKTIALTFKVNGQAFASIASVSLKTVNLNLLGRYRDEKEFGILCTEQRRSTNVVFLDPLWIWNE
jgi:hypothetical protein